MFPILFDVAFVAIILWGIGLCAFEKYGYALMSMIGLLVGSWFVFEPFKNFIQSIGWHSILLKWVPLYLAAGVVVALIKWFFHILKTTSKISDAKETFKNTAAADTKDDAARREKFVSHYMEANKYGSSSRTDYISVDSIPDKRWKEEGIVAELLTPRAKKHMDRISFWVLEWPYVIIATIFDDILIKFARNVARFFDYAFTAASRVWIARVVKGI